MGMTPPLKTPAGRAVNNYRLRRNLWEMAGLKPEDMAKWSNRETEEFHICMNAEISAQNAEVRRREAKARASRG